MLHLEKIKDPKNICCQCKEIATIKINDMFFCPKCGDDILLRTIAKISKVLQQVSVKISLTLDTKTKK